jgi:hypothetical protein
MNGIESNERQKIKTIYLGGWRGILCALQHKWLQMAAKAACFQQGNNPPKTTRRDGPAP